MDPAELSDAGLDLPPPAGAVEAGDREAYRPSYGPVAGSVADLLGLMPASVQRLARVNTAALRRCGGLTGCVASRGGRSAWLITWESVGTHAAPPLGTPVAAVLRPQLGPETVRRHVEMLYMAFAYTAAEMLAVLPPHGHNPYPAVFGTIAIDDGGWRQVVTYTGQITCGHSPSLYARVVTRLRLAEGTYDDGSRRLAWQEHVRPVVDPRTRPGTA